MAGWRITLHITLGLILLGYLGSSSQMLTEEEMRNPPALVCRDVAYRSNVQERPHPFFTISETYPSLAQFIPETAAKALNWWYCFITPTFYAMFNNPWSNVVMDLFMPAFATFMAWGAVEALTNRSGKGGFAKLIMRATPVTFALGQFITIGAVAHIFLLPSWIYLQKNTRVTGLPTATLLSTVLVQTFLMLLTTGIASGSPERVILWSIAFLQLSPVLSPLLWLTSAHRIVGIPLIDLFSKKSSAHPLPIFWKLIAVVASFAHLQAVARIIALILTYDTSSPAIYGTVTPVEWWTSRPPLTVAAVFHHLMAWHTQKDFGRALMIYDFILVSLAYTALQWERFTGLTAILCHVAETLILGPAGSFAMWQSKACEKDIALVESATQKKSRP